MIFFRLEVFGQALIQILDMMSDCFLAIEFSLKLETGEKFLIPLYICIAFIAIPSLFSLYQVYKYSQKHWSKDNKVREWLISYSKLLYLLSVLTGSSFTAIEITNSHLFNLKYFEMGLSNKQKTKFKTKRIYSGVMMEVIHVQNGVYH